MGLGLRRRGRLLTGWAGLLAPYVFLCQILHMLGICSWYPMFSDWTDVIFLSTVQYKLKFLIHFQEQR